MPLVPQYIQALSPYNAGRTISEVAREFGLERIIKMASNENPLGPSPLALKAAGEALGEANYYPDPSVHELRTALAERFNVKMANVIAGSGSEGIMATIMRTFLLESDELVSAANSFIGFRVLANASGRRTHWIPMKRYRYDLTAIADAITDYTKIVYLANPDNPTGTYFTKAEFDTFMERVPDRVLVILDEAYFEFARENTDFPDSMHYRYDNVITLRTFSKSYGLAGLRIGYGFAHDELIGNLMKVKLAFEPSIQAQAAGLAALGDEEYLLRTLENNRKGMAFLYDAFQQLGIETIPSVTNFITLVFPHERIAREISYALLQRGIIVRHLTPFGWPRLIRVTVGLPEENEYFVTHLEKVMGEIHGTTG